MTGVQTCALPISFMNITSRCKSRKKGRNRNVRVKWVENKQITSPDGKLVVTVSDMDGRPSYSVSYDNVLFLKPSPLGMIANIGDFSSGMSLEKNVSTNKIDETYELASIKQSKVRYVANEAVFSFTQQGKTIYDVIFRISNNDVDRKSVVRERV